MSSETLAISIICALATAGVILRPFSLPEAVFALIGAAALVLFGLLPVSDAVRGVARGNDVYLFLIGMMLLAELARREGLFDVLAVAAVRRARGSASRLFNLCYLIGTLVTIFLSNDATAVVLTPAVYAAARKAKVEPLPYLFICAFIANAASFVLPISNPANLVIFGEHMPPLAEWLRRFALPSLAAILLTFALLRLMLRDALRGELATNVDAEPLSRGGWLSAVGIGVTALALMGASFLGRDLGLPTFLAGVLTALLTMIATKSNPLPMLKGISWSVLPLVAGLFVLVEALEKTGVTGFLAGLIAAHARVSPAGTALVTGAALAFGSNLVNNLPAGLLAAATLAQGGDALPPVISDAVLIGVDLGPNLSVTGSLATILWLVVLRREGESVSAWRFLKLGLVVMPPALLAALGVSALLAH